METVMVVEDEVELRELIEDSLSSSGFNVIACGNGLEAIEAFLIEKPAVIITDILMPEMDGMELLQSVWNVDITHTTQAIIMTGVLHQSRNTNILQAYELGARGFFEKPFDLKELIQTVESLVDR